MNMRIDGLDVMEWADLEILPSDRSYEISESHGCDSCGEVKPDVDIFAEDSTTGDVLRLCRSCGEW